MTAPQPEPRSATRRVLTVAPMPPEKIAYALARYSRSPDSVRESLEWVRAHDSNKFLESFYFQYGHASIADLGHLTICFEGISELAATEIQDEQLWDGQARSSRYQDFSKSGVVVPPELTADEQSIYNAAAGQLLDSYRIVQDHVFAHLSETLPKPDEMKPDAYRRNLTARAFDVARYLLPFGVPTGVGQVTSIRTLEKQMRRLKASEFQEVREIGEELGHACAQPAECVWDNRVETEPVAPTLARHARPDESARHLRADVAEWASDNLPPSQALSTPPVELLLPMDPLADICATLLYPVTDRPYRELYGVACSWSVARRRELLEVALGSHTKRDELPRHFRNAPYVFDIVMDIGAYRDLHRHRRCQQFRQQYTNRLGFEAPDVIAECGLESTYSRTLDQANAAISQLPQPAAQYLLPFASRSRFLFKMDFAELEYVSSPAQRSKGPLRVSEGCVGDEARARESRSGAKCLNRRYAALGGRPVETVV